MAKIESGSLSARIYSELRRALIAGDYSPGERLKMQDLAVELGTSVTPVREACLRLVSEQALELRSGRFIVVPELTRARYWQIRQIRIALECLATREGAANCSAEDIARLKSLHDKFVQHEAKGHQVKARHANQQFHFALYALCGMPLLMGQIEAMWASMGPILNVFYLTRDHEYVGAYEHLAIMDALANHDGIAAAAALERDIVAGGLDILRHFDRMDSV